MDIKDYLIFEANDINHLLDEKIDYDAFVRIDAVRECYLKQLTLRLFTSNTTYTFVFKNIKDAEELYTNIITDIITDTSQ